MLRVTQEVNISIVPRVQTNTVQYIGLSFHGLSIQVPLLAETTGFK